MNNPNSPFNKLKKYLDMRWSKEDYPGGNKRFQLALLGKDIAGYLCLPVLTVVAVKTCDSKSASSRRSNVAVNRIADMPENEHKSQIVEFRDASAGPNSTFARKSPGTLVKVKLLNVVETFSAAPVHVQVTDLGLGRSLLGATLIGDASPDTNFERINIAFRFARDPNKASIAASISARALSFDGTLGVQARRKEGFIARSVVASSSLPPQGSQSQASDADFKQILFRALTAGLMQEYGSTSQLEKNRSQVLILNPGTEFFAELTDFFPGSSR